MKMNYADVAAPIVLALTGIMFFVVAIVAIGIGERWLGSDPIDSGPTATVVPCDETD